MPDCRIACRSRTPQRLGRSPRRWRVASHGTRGVDIGRAAPASAQECGFTDRVRRRRSATGIAVHVASSAPRAPRRPTLRGGEAWRQTSMTIGHRGGKRHPIGGVTRLGGSPLVANPVGTLSRSGSESRSTSINRRARQSETVASSPWRALALTAFAQRRRPPGRPQLCTRDRLLIRARTAGHSRSRRSLRGRIGRPLEPGAEHVDIPVGDAEPRLALNV